MAVRTKVFWLLAGTFFVCGATTNGLISTHLIPAAHDHGIAQVTAAGLLALVGLFDVIGTTASGWLTDRYDPRKLLVVYYGSGACPCSRCRWRSTRRRRDVAFVVVYGLDWVATVPPTSALANNHFGAAVGRRLRLDLRCAPARRRDRSLGGRADPHGDRRVHRRLPGRRRARARAAGAVLLIRSARSAAPEPAPVM